jgi:uncharacterized membrane protein YebE (DUF533 family)
MIDFKDLLGQMMQSGMNSSTQDRLKHAMGDRGLGGAGGMLSDLMGGLQSGGAGGGIGDIGRIAEKMLGGSKLATGGLGALAGALLGGGRGAGRGALGGGLMALLGSMAMSAFKNMNQPADKTDSKMMPLGLREPENENEELELQNNAQLILRAMINAAKADGQIDQAEIQRITGQLEEIGADDEARSFVLQEMGKPSNLSDITGAVHSTELGAQVYAASLLAIKLDTPAEKQYMQDLAEGLGLDSYAKANIHKVLGLDQ